MEREANYAAVGAFVVLVVVMAVLFVYWYSDAREHRDYTRYEVYFEGSVSGLERGAPVRYLGVDIGRVYSMRIDPRDAARVQVLVDLDLHRARLRQDGGRIVAPGRNRPALHGSHPGHGHSPAHRGCAE